MTAKPFPDTTSSPISDPIWPVDVRRFTSAPLQMEGNFLFEASAAEVFERVTDPQQLAGWFPIITGGRTDHSDSEHQGTWGVGSKRYCDTVGMGSLDETILYWQQPYAYAYRVKNWTMPIADHCAVMLVQPLADQGCRLIWRQYYRPVGLFLKYLFPHVMVTMMNQGMESLRRDLGGRGGQMRLVK